ncbi:MAG: class I SAM-dependent methyltransferase [Desulfobacterales bacterium]|nr:MAG: class I SAM-dependent methyltransferase [Desulfobacterales bacterium]
MITLADLSDRGILPDRLIRFGIRRLDKKRLQAEKRRNIEDQGKALFKFIDSMRNSPIAIRPEKPNEQHYEIPPAFFQNILGKHLKYSGCYWPAGVTNLDEAEEQMLMLTCKRAELEDGMEILELGCGWGSLTLWMAERYPESRVVAVSNSRLQADFIRARCVERNLKNITVITEDMNSFSIDRQFDRVVSVEMFEHMRNWPLLLQNISQWLKPEGKLFMHIFCHRKFAYTYDDEGDKNWMGKYFFSGGVMPSYKLLFYFQCHLMVENHWYVNGLHYSKTAEAWLANLDRNRNDIMPILQGVYEPKEAERWLQRWRIFFMACAELWGYRNGQEWLVSHYLLRKK